MVAWIQQNSSLLQVVSSFGMLAVWLFYAHLLFINFRSAQTPSILITQGVATRGQARCMVTNMSANSVFVQCIVAHLKTTHGYRTCSVTDFHAEQGDEVADSLQNGTGQGPLPAGSYLDVGSLSAMVRSAQQAPLTDVVNEIKSDDEEEKPVAINVYVIAAYSQERGEIGATRRFELGDRTDDGGYVTRPTYVDTQQLRNVRSRRRMRRWLRKFL